MADRSRLEILATCAFIREADNVLFMGPPGVGKSHLAVALGVKAIKNGFSTTHFVLDDLMHVLQGRRGDPASQAQGQALPQQGAPSSSTRWASGPSSARRRTSSSAS